MADIDLHREFNSSGESVQDLFDKAEEGFFVPPYQREYTWEEDNVNQLFDDLVLGTRELSEKTTATTFLGTTILTELGDKNQAVMVGEDRARPTGVQIVIDGQQRISTLALLSIQIIVKIKELLASLPKKPPYEDLHNAGEAFSGRLKKLHSMELGKGASPASKPKIISDREDKWTYQGDDSAYGSPVALYIATFIRTNSSTIARDALAADKGARVRGNVKLIDDWLCDVSAAHVPGSKLFGQFPIGAAITSTTMQEYVLGFSDDGVREVVAKAETKKAQTDYFAAATFQLLLLAYYLLRRCGVNRLQPTHEEWGFDMFQALNTTGTPLTVMETFLPQVMQSEYGAGNDWGGTPSSEYMEEILELFNVTTTNEQKNRRTNELLGAFALCYNGTKLGNKFSEQRRWLTRVYEKELSSIDDKREFVRKLSKVAEFFYHAWYLEEGSIPGLVEDDDRELASFLIQYLKDANSRLSTPILARFFCQLLDGETSSDDFIECARACAAFFTLWRSGNSTSGLDDVYRKYFRSGPAGAGRSWSEKPDSLSVSSLKKYFLDTLEHKGVAGEDAWVAASQRFLMYSELKTVCRFVLFVAAHDRVVDQSAPGLTTAGTKGSCNMLTLARWKAKECKSIEHVAPQRPPEGHAWSLKIYENELVHQVGNLMLLPIQVNRFVDNKSWEVKCLHYSHVGERDQGKLNQLKERAETKGIVLSKRATAALSKMGYICAAEPILSVTEEGQWDAQLVERRTAQIKKIAWQTLSSWLVA